MGKLCQACRAIDFAWLLAEENREHHLEPGHGRRLQQQMRLAKRNLFSCSFCRSVLSLSSKAEAQFPKKEQLVLGLEFVNFGTSTGGPPLRGISVSISAPGLREHPYSLVDMRKNGPSLVLDTDALIRRLPTAVAGGGGSGKGCGGRRLGTRVDIDTIKTWLQCCETVHSNSCKPRELKSPFRKSIRLIDVQHGCIVETPPGAYRYSALSYVWGGIQQLRLLRSNSDSLSQDGGLWKMKRQIPPSVMDAILLCAKIGERYLWVDSLCVMQDELEDIEVQIAHMGSIYMSADLTIVAAAGQDANAGLPGFRPGTRCASEQVSLNVGGVPLISVASSVVDELKSSAWSTRGWTLQEQILSPRLLVFLLGQAFFFCRKSLFREDLVSSGPEEGSSGVALAEHARMTSVRSSIIQDLQSRGESLTDEDAYRAYSQISHDMAKRKFTFAGDILYAFAGIEECLSSSSGLGGFIYGHPRKWFLPSLLWQPGPRGSRYRGVAHFRDDQRLPIPTWSWCGWEYDLPPDIQHVDAARVDCIQGPRMYRFHPTKGTAEIVEIEWSRNSRPHKKKEAALLENPSPPELVSLKQAASCLPDPYISNLIFAYFWATTSTPILQESRGSNFGKYWIKGPGGRLFGEIQYVESLFPEDEYLKLAALAYDHARGLVYTVVVKAMTSFEDGIYRRFLMPKDPISIGDWNSLETEEILIAIR